jgi:hypothetical protein
MALRLVYFPVRAKAECIRMALRFGKVEYEDVSVSDHFGAGWGAGAKAMAPFNQLPILVVGDAPPLAQSGSIMRYVSGLAGLAPDPADMLTAARCDMIFEASQELATGDSNVNPIVNVFKGEQFETKKTTFFGLAPAKITNLAKQHELCSGGAAAQARSSSAPSRCTATCPSGTCSPTRCCLTRRPSTPTRPCKLSWTRWRPYPASRSTWRSDRTVSTLGRLRCSRPNDTKSFFHFILPSRSLALHASALVSNGHIRITYYSLTSSGHLSDHGYSLWSLLLLLQSINKYYLH